MYLNSISQLMNIVEANPNVPIDIFSVETVYVCKLQCVFLIIIPIEQKEKEKN